MKRYSAVLLSFLSVIVLVVLNLSFFQIQPIFWLKYFSLILTLIFAGKGFGKIISDFTDNKDHSLLGLPLFFLFSGLITWIINVVFSGSSSLVLVIFLFSCISYFFIRKVGNFKEDLKLNFESEVILFNSGLLLFFTFLTAVSFHLNLNTGEKPMDYAILNYFYNHEKGVPTDIWAAGSGFSYYYLGFFSWAKWLKIFSIGPDYGYPFSFAMTVWLFFQSLFALFKLVFKTTLLRSILSSLFVLLIPSFQVIKQIVIGKKWDFPMYWNSTRIFKENLFSEFPIWSFTFGDFHPHVMNYPFMISFLALLLSFKSFEKISLRHLFFVVLTGVAMTMMNIWEGIFLSLFTFVWYCWSWRNIDIREGYQKMILNPLLCILAGLVVALPWLKTLLTHSSSAGQFGLNKAPSNGVLEYYMLYGVLVLIIFFSVVVLLLKKEILFGVKQLKNSSLLIFFYLPAFILGMMNPGMNGKIFSAIMLLGILFSLILISHEKEDLSFIGLLMFVSLGLIHYAENLILLDRINSLFKTNTFTFVILSICCVVLFYKCLDSLRIKYSHFVFSGVILVFAFTSFVLGKSIHTIAYSASSSFSTPIEHFRNRLNGDHAVVQWLRANANANEVLLEYFGAPYKYESSRISTYSGVPSFLGWAGQHVTQRGLSHQELERRKVQIKRIYSVMAVDQIHQVLKKEGIKYVVTGRFESQKISAPGLEKFDKSPDKFEKVVHHLPTGTRLYRVK